MNDLRPKIVRPKKEATYDLKTLQHKQIQVTTTHDLQYLQHITLQLATQHARLSIGQQRPNNKCDLK